jgi:hypothetical protein
VTAGCLGRALTLVSCLQAVDASAGDRPNIVLILADDLGYADVGFTGGREIPTPHIDRLAAGGVQFSQGYVSHPFCSPSRAGLLTGRYQQRFGHENNPKYDPRDERSGLPLDEVTLADVLRRAGVVLPIGFLLDLPGWSGGMLRESALSIALTAGLSILLLVRVPSWPAPSGATWPRWGSRS